MRMSAVLMLECGMDEARKACSYLRLLKISVKTAQYCQEHNVLSLASKMLERAAKFQAELSQLTTDVQKSPVQDIASARIDYFLARVSLV